MKTVLRDHVEALPRPVVAAKQAGFDDLYGMPTRRRRSPRRAAPSGLTLLDMEKDMPTASVRGGAERAAARHRDDERPHAGGAQLPLAEGADALLDAADR